MRMLIANPYGIGDVLFSIPLVRALKAADPGGVLGYLCNARTEPLVGPWPELSWVSVFEKEAFREAFKASPQTGVRSVLQLRKAIRAEKFDHFLDLSLGWQLGALAWAAGVRNRLGFNFKRRGRFLTSSFPLSGFHNNPVAEYYLSLLSLLKIKRPEHIDGTLHLPAETQSEGKRMLKQAGVPAGTKLVGLVPGGGASWGPMAPYKIWPAERFVQTADTLAELHQTGILLLGDQADQTLCKEILQKTKARAWHLPPAPSLLTLAGLLRQCALVIGNDGGAMHLASAVGVKTVTIFGPVDGSVYGPYPYRQDRHRVVGLGLACRPCYRNFRVPPCPWENRCLKELQPKAVIDAAAELLL